MPSFINNVRSLLGPELALWQHAHDKLLGPTDPGDDSGRVVAYLDDRATQSGAEVFKQAMGQWLAQPANVAHRVHWQQRQCVDASGQPGRDAAECDQEHIAQFPSLRYFAAGSSASQAIDTELKDDQSSPEGLVSDVRKLVTEDAKSLSAGLRMVLYDGAPGCAECAPLRASWDDAIRQWHQMSSDVDVPPIAWQTKRCIGRDGGPGPDAVTCAKQGTESLPAVRFERVGAPSVVASIEFHDSPTPEGFVNFAKHETGIDFEGPALDTATLAEDLAMELDHIHPAALDYRVHFYNSASGQKSLEMSRALNEAKASWIDLERQTGAQESKFAENLGAFERKFAKSAGDIADVPLASEDLDGSVYSRVPLVQFEGRQCFNRVWQPGADHAVCMRHGIKTLPTIRLEKIGGSESDIIEYSGPATKKDILAFLADKLIPRKARNADSHETSAGAADDKAGERSNKGPDGSIKEVSAASKAELADVADPAAARLLAQSMSFVPLDVAGWKAHQSRSCHGGRRRCQNASYARFVGEGRLFL